MVIVILSIIC